MVNATKDDAGFVSSWIEKYKTAQPECPIVQAVVAATCDGRIDESKLLQDLRALTLMPHTESEK